MNFADEAIVQITEDVKCMLQDDLVSAGELRQIATNSLGHVAGLAGYMVPVIRRLLVEGVEIGSTLNTGGTYVKFVAWRGSTAERCERAIREFESCIEIDRDFAFWLCLSANVDEYE